MKTDCETDGSSVALVRTPPAHPAPPLKSRGANTVTYLTLTGDNYQEILALTGGGKTREYTETRPDGTTVTYTIDVEEEIVEVGDGRQ